MGVHPNVSYCPVPGLVALFARATLCARNPRAPRSHPWASSGFSYAPVLMSRMDRGNFNDNGNRGGFNIGFENR
jgi:hypothetical protein